MGTRPKCKRLERNQKTKITHILRVQLGPLHHFRVMAADRDEPGSRWPDLDSQACIPTCRSITAVTSFPVLEGQSVGIIVPGADERGRPHRMRLYSVASPRDGERPNTNNLALTVKRAFRLTTAEASCDLLYGIWETLVAV